MKTTKHSIRLAGCTLVLLLATTIVAQAQTRAPALDDSPTGPGVQRADEKSAPVPAMQPERAARLAALEDAPTGPGVADNAAVASGPVRQRDPNLPWADAVTGPGVHEPGEAQAPLEGAVDHEALMGAGQPAVQAIRSPAPQVLPAGEIDHVARMGGGQSPEPDPPAPRVKREVKIDHDARMGGSPEVQPAGRGN
jgi:hypothetical protein